MKYLLAVGTILLVTALGEVDALSCYKCKYNITLAAPEHNPKCGDPFDGDMIRTQTCSGDQECAKYPAYLGDRSGQFLASIERRCAKNTGDGCIKIEDAKGGFLKICGYFCQEDTCNNAGVLKLHIVAVFMMLIFTILVVTL